MKLFLFGIYALITIMLIVLLNSTLALQAPLGKLLSPQQGLWQNAEPLDEDYSAALVFPQLQGKASVYFDERLIPHVFADNEMDAYFVQG